ncbi:odorant receptor 204 [Tribolium castaneum]|uniref:Odorant receptor n=1 Tax=Tribolium castaneum TaxID=7070 RepID=D6X3G2_TRICA|nr:odorant receptor 204 [Tribolium castaneum]
MTNFFSNFCSPLKNHWAKTKHLFSKFSLSSDQPFIMIKLVCVDIGYHPVAKTINYICLAIHISSFLLEMNYLRLNFSTDLLIKYGCGISAVVYDISTLIVAPMIERPTIGLSEGITTSFWPIDFCGPKVKQLILEDTKKTSKIYYRTLVTIFGFAAVIMLPIWGDQKEWFLCVQVYEHYFGKWAQIPYHIYFLSFMWFAFTSVRLPLMMSYAIKNIRVQVFLVNQKIAKMSKEYEEAKIEDVNYQNRVYKNLRLCISHHVLLKWWLRKLQKIVRFCLPVFVVIGILTESSVVFYLIYNFKKVNLLLKIRFLLLACTTGVIIYFFSEAGQSLYIEVFDSLISCPWYSWNVKNRKVLLIFLTNSLQPMFFSLVGFTIDYRFALTMIRTSFSYAIILYNLSSGSQIASI